MASKADICNAALSNLGAAPSVTSIDPPDGGAYSLHCARTYTMALQYLLASHPWQFALKRKALAAVSDAPNDQWSYAKALPSDCLRPIALLPAGAENDTAGIEYVIEGTTLYCDEDDVTLLYIIADVEPGRMPPFFVNAFADRMAYMLATPVMKADASTRGFLKQTADASMRQAAVIDAMSRKQKTSDHIPEWIRGR